MKIKSRDVWPEDIRSLGTCGPLGHAEQLTVLAARRNVDHAGLAAHGICGPLGLADHRDLRTHGTFVLRTWSPDHLAKTFDPNILPEHFTLTFNPNN